MFNLIINELYKLRYKKKFLITVIVFSLLSALICFGTYKSNENARNNNNIDNKIQWAKEDVNQYERDLKEARSEAQKKSIKASIESRKKDIDILEAQKISKNVDWKESLRQNLKMLQAQKKQLKTSYAADDAQKEEINTNIIKYKYLLKHNIKPLEDNSNNGFLMLISVMEIIGPLFLCIIIAIMIADIVSGEYTPPTMKVLLSKPVSRTKVLLSKYIAAILSSIITIVLLEGITFLITSLIFGSGDPYYPVIIGKRFHESKIIGSMGDSLQPVVGSSYVTSTSKFIILMILIQAMFIIAFVSFCFMLSTVLKTSMLSVSLSVVAYIVQIIVIQLPYVKKIGRFLFVPYSSPGGLLQGDIAGNFGDAAMTTGFAVIVFLCWTVICYGISQFVFTKRDLLI